MTKKGLKDTEFKDFLVWEMYAQDTIDFKRAYVDMAGDLVSGLLLSQIVYWHLPDKQGRCKLRVWKQGLLWLAKSASDWYDEVRITSKQATRALKILESKGIITKQIFRFNGAPTTHLRILPEGFMVAWHEVLAQATISPKGTNPFTPEVQNHSDQKGKSITEITTEIITKKPVSSPKPITPVTEPPSEPTTNSGAASFICSPLTEEEKNKVHPRVAAMKKKNLLAGGGDSGVADPTVGDAKLHSRWAWLIGIRYPMASKEMKRNIRSACRKVTEGCRGDVIGILGAIDDKERTDKEAFDWCKGSSPFSPVNSVMSHYHYLKTRQGQEEKAGANLVAQKKAERDRMQAIARAHGH